jgi:hypothetical protein
MCSAVQVQGADRVVGITQTGESVATEALPEKDQQPAAEDDMDDLAANLLPRKQRLMYGRVKANIEAKKARGQELQRRKQKLQNSA